MDYHECLAHLEKLGNEVMTMKFGLETIRELLKPLGNPHLKYPSVLIAGTNGKGSVARFLSSVCTACGIRNGLYTSPHLMRPEERFVVDDVPVKPRVFAHYFARVLEAVDELQLPSPPTYFEILTAVAFLYFLERKVELAILEVGMGGRLDSTNVVDPLVAILTPVGLDHQKFLGETLEEVAHEKAGILREGKPALTAPQRPQVQKVFLSEAHQKKVALAQLDSSAIDCLGSTHGKYAFRFHGLECQLSLYGRHQVENAALAIQAVEILGRSGFSVPKSCIKKGIEEASWMGRIQVLGQNPTIVLDGAHNLDAAKNLVNFLTQHTPAPRTLVFAIMQDKDIALVLETLEACFQRIYLTCIDSPRAASIDQLKSLLPSALPIKEPFAAYRQALSSSAATVVVAGSFYLVGKILKRL
ncbi:bifunctional folylpolyglutamate synthase/dihydrofolate synthase [Acidobacteria bacterium AH-259-D05]|nr:bifunctional folylpolyglutamate synthase/dihydrofolate synthase [Acidobacteria bacterium AH-259-D05]